MNAGSRTSDEVVVSVVSHGQGNIVVNLLNDIGSVCDCSNIRVILTINKPEVLPFDPDAFPFDMTVIRNVCPRGFATNHNVAFQATETPAFCVVNPDIRLRVDPFPSLMAAIQQSEAGIAAPKIVTPLGAVEDSARRSIAPHRIGRRVLRLGGRNDYVIAESLVYPDWVAGMMMLFASEVFAEIGGFNERYFMYCEDADICTRVWRKGSKVVLVPWVSVTHDARRNSHHDLQHLRWHIASLLRFFITNAYSVR